LIRRAGLVVAVVAAAVLATRVAVVDALAERRPELAAEMWPTHPRVVTARGFMAIGASAAAGKRPPAGVTAELNSTIRRDPLNSSALLVSGTKAFADGNLGRAEQLLLAASEREPFAPAPRYLLADLYLRQGRAQAGLAQLDFLIRRVGSTAAALLPAMVQFSRMPGGARQLKSLLSAQPVLREQLLEMLAADPRNLSTILTLAGPQRRSSAPQWQPTLLAAMIANQNYNEAHRVWLRFAGLPAREANELFNPRFRPNGPPPPFNWRFGNGSAGLAETQPDGGLHILYYGREDTVLAEQVLLLPPGRYRLKQERAGAMVNLSWAVVCLPMGPSQEAPANGDLHFSVAAGCRAQRLELRGSLADVPTTLDTTIRQVNLVREGAP